MRSFLFLVFVCSLYAGNSQVKLSGQVADRSGPLPGGSLKVLDTDSTFVTGTATDLEGNFILTVAPGKKYILVCSFLGYKTQSRTISVEAAMTLPTITLAEDTKNLSEVEVKAIQARGEQRGDTTQFNAGAYKTNPDANAEDLIKKMPGITSDNTGVKVNGETVQKVLVDGKPFFGDDPNAALKNLPAEVIDKVEIFDKLSDQAQFTGFSDGEQKTINIVTKKGKNEGQFGKVYAGYGADEEAKERYQAGAVVNSFKDKQRLTLLLLSNNINQQNFSAADLSGSQGSQQQQRGGRGGSQALLASPQPGNTITHSAGLNYGDKWGKKIDVSGSYFFNRTENRNTSGITRNYYTDDQLVYQQVNDDIALNQNHRVNFRFEYNIDSANKLTIVPSLNLQNNNTSSLLTGSNTVFDNLLLSKTRTESGSSIMAYDFSNSVLFQHRFEKKGRSVSLNVSTQLAEKSSPGNYRSLNEYADTTASGLDQVYTLFGNTTKVSANLAYTEPVGKYGQVQVNYLPSYTIGNSEKKTNDYNAVNSDYTDLNTSLSNQYNNIYVTQRGGLAFKYRKEKLNADIGADMQQANLNGDQTYPQPVTIKQSFVNVLPSARFNYRFSKTRNLRFNYRTSTNVPNMTQLQNVIDISNPLQIKTGNSSLKQSFEHNIFVRYGGFDPTTSRNIMFFVNASRADNQISSATYILRRDSVIQGYEAKAGSQLTKPVNVDGLYSARVFAVYGFPVTAIKSNLSFNGGFNYNHTPSIIDYEYNLSNSYAPNAGLTLGSNISENLDFSLGYNGSYTAVKNTIQKQSDNDYYTHTASLKINWIFLKGFVFNTDLNHTTYKGLSQGYNQDYLLWNAYIGYKFLKKRALEAKVSVFDILNQNRSISRTVTGLYTEDVYTQVLKRYAMVTLTYTFRNFKSGDVPKEPEGQEPGRRWNDR